MTRLYENVFLVTRPDQKRHQLGHLFSFPLLFFLLITRSWWHLTTKWLTQARGGMSNRQSPFKRGGFFLVVFCCSTGRDDLPGLFHFMFYRSRISLPAWHAQRQNLISCITQIWYARSTIFHEMLGDSDVVIFRAWHTTTASCRTSATTALGRGVVVQPDWLDFSDKILRKADMLGWSRLVRSCVAAGGTIIVLGLRIKATHLAFLVGALSGSVFNAY